MHEALREALANCLINTDYYGSRGVVITLHSKRITLANPGYSRTGKKQMMLGGISDPRNRGLMKMFNLIDIGERAGSGIPKIVNIWNNEGLKDPVIEERFDPDRTLINLSLEKKQAIKGSDKTSDHTPAKSQRTAENQKRILDYLKDNGRSSCVEIAGYIGLSVVRTRAIISEMKEVEALGENRNRTYRIR